jgi:hypothetical protein
MNTKDFTLCHNCKTKPLLLAVSVISAWILCACAHPLSLHSADGERLDGKWRFARNGTGVMQLLNTDGEVISGRFEEVARRRFAENYERTFGPGTIALYGPDLSSYGNPFSGLLGRSSAVTEVAEGENIAGVTGKPPPAVSGPLFYWTAALLGDRGTFLECYFIGSSYTGRGFGRCKSAAGKHYAVEF